MLDGRTVQPAVFTAEPRDERASRKITRAGSEQVEEAADAAGKEATRRKKENKKKKGKQSEAGWKRGGPIGESPS